MKTAQEWFDLYAESHRNPTNKLIHWACIPAIAVSTLGLLQAVPHPFGNTGLHWGVAAGAATLLFYVRLSWTIGLGMAAAIAAGLALNLAMAGAGFPIGWVSAGVFAVAWVAQFIGHKIEGKKPSFFQDLQFLLVGPAWLLQFVYRRVGVPVAR
jgi:uncharacterized membrane protein YGL010W